MTANVLEVKFFVSLSQAHFVEHNAELGFETQTNTLDENGFSDDEIGLPKKSKQRKKVNISGKYVRQIWSIDRQNVQNFR